MIDKISTFLKILRVDMSDLSADRSIMFQHKHYVLLGLLTSVVFPIGVLYYVFGESILTAFMFAVMTRYVVTLHFTWLINSAAHMFGMKPFDSHISPVENKIVALFALGEGKSLEII